MLQQHAAPNHGAHTLKRSKNAAEKNSRCQSASNLKTSKSGRKKEARFATDIRISANSNVSKRRDNRPWSTFKRGTQIADRTTVNTLNLIDMIKGCLSSHTSDPKVSYLLDQFTSKYCDSTTVAPQVRAKAAIDKLVAAESRNQSINTWGYGYFTKHTNLSSVLGRAQHLVANVLGSFDFDEFYEGCRFSNGATTSRSKEFGHPYFKYSVNGNGLDVTRSALPYAIEAIRRRPTWFSYLAEVEATFFKPLGKSVINLVSWNKIGTVPKKTDCDRATASEPDLNMFLQLSVGTMIKKRLRKFGVDLKNQHHNKNLARVGSLLGTWATIDLSSASDLNSQRLVWDLLPPEWFVVMDDLRAKFGKLPNGDVIQWEMFSAMGNGFTFELESLLFWALATAATESMDPTKDDFQISVYGDDIICPTYAAEAVIEVLEAVGHKPNVEKTFYDGPFRESCGGHYHNGNDISPFYIREPIEKLTSLIRLGNQIRKWSTQDGTLSETYLIPVWNFIKGLVPPCLHGGRDLERSDALVTNDRPAYRLTAVRKLLCDTGLPYFFASVQKKSDDEAGLDVSLSDVRLLRQKLSRFCDKGFLYVISEVDVGVGRASSFVSALTMPNDSFEGQK